MALQRNAVAGPGICILDILFTATLIMTILDLVTPEKQVPMIVVYIMVESIKMQVVLFLLNQRLTHLQSAFKLFVTWLR
jgi:hypothetical protein